jgi:hypothetical protein
MENAEVGLVNCPECGAEKQAAADDCWLCKASRLESGTKVEPAKAESLVAEAHDPTHQTFTLNSLLLIVTLVAVCLGVVVQAPGLGVPLALLSAPALFRTVRIRSIRRTRGVAMSGFDKALVFLGSLAVVTIITAASLAAFVAICFSMGLVAFEINSQGLFGLAWILGIGGGLLVGVLLFRWLWWLRM